MIDHCGKVIEAAQPNGLIFGQPAEFGVLARQRRIALWITQFGQPIDDFFWFAFHIVAERHRKVAMDEQIVDAVAGLFASLAQCCGEIIFAGIDMAW